MGICFPGRDKNKKYLKFHHLVHQGQPSIFPQGYLQKTH